MISLNEKNIIICGIDEAGRGALAGPLVAAAVILTLKQEKILRQSNLTIKDSKLLSNTQRLKMYEKMKKLNIYFLSEVFSARRINNRGISYANKESIRKLIRKTHADQYIVDGRMKLGRINGKTSKISCIVDADATILPTILAGIVAKVERDRLMHDLHELQPVYKWNNNAGYGTKEHIEAIHKYGAIHLHRNIFVTTALRGYLKNH